MVFVEGGELHLPEERFHALDAEDVYVDAFSIDVAEVTVAAFRECVGAGRCAMPGPAHGVWKTDLCNGRARGKDDHPMNCVPWRSARDYCAFRGKRLPSDREWHWAARRGARRFPWGDAEPGAFPCWRRGDRGTCAVGSSAGDATPDGILDLGGNVSEWTSTPAPKCADDTGPCQDGHVACGGNWALDSPKPEYLPKDLLVARQADSGTIRDPRLGFRCAASR